MTAADAEEPPLARVHDLAGRPRGVAFAADADGTLVTTHEAVDGLRRVVVATPGGCSRVVEAPDITALPGRDLALLRTGEPGLAPLLVGAEGAHPAGTPVRVWADGWLHGRVAGGGAATYTSTERRHPVDDALALTLPGAGRFRLSGRLSGTPVLHADTGAVLGVIGTALDAPPGSADPGPPRTPTPGRFAGHDDSGRAAGRGDSGTVLAVPLRPAVPQDPGCPVAALLRRNDVTVPGFGPDLNLAGVLRLTAPFAAGPQGPYVPRPDLVQELCAFDAGDAQIAALVGPPGTGRSTELAAHAARRATGPAPAPTVRLRGADLREGDGGVRDAVGRALAGAADPDVMARLARAAGRPLLVVLDGPEEMPTGLARELRRWTGGTVSWLRAVSGRLTLACRPEFWEQAGSYVPRHLLHAPRAVPHGPRLAAQGPAGALPPCLPAGPLPPAAAARLRETHGVPEDALAPADAGHPLAVRMLGEVRAALGRDGDGTPAGLPAAPAAAAGPLARADVFAAHLDLVSLRIAGRLAREREPAPGPAAVRRLAARAAGQLHEAARRCLGTGHGTLDGAAFDELLPEAGGWAAAVLAEGVLVPAGPGHRFADEEFADWLQGCHLGLDAALDALVHRPEPGLPGGSVPRHRIGPVVEALLWCARREGHGALARRLHPLVGPALEASPGASARRTDDRRGPGRPPERQPVGPAPAGPGPADPRQADPRPAEPAAGADAGWWAAHLLGETLLRLPAPGLQRDRPCHRVLEDLADRIGERGDAGDFGPWFWRRLPLDTADRCALLRRLLPADRPPEDVPGPPGAPGTHGAPGTPGTGSHPSSAHGRPPTGGPGALAHHGPAAWPGPAVAPAGTAAHPGPGAAGRHGHADGQGAVPGPGPAGPWPRGRARPAGSTGGPDPADGPAPGSGESPADAPAPARFLDEAAAFLTAEPRTVQPLLCAWFDDERPLAGSPDTVTVAGAAQALLHTHRRRDPAGLAEALADALPHPRARELLAELARDEPAALCRAVDRWAHDPRPRRHAVARTFGVRVARHVRTDAERALLRCAALRLLALAPAGAPGDPAALALLARDPATRHRHLDAAVACFVDTGDPALAGALGTALATRPGKVLSALRARLDTPGARPSEALRMLAEAPGEETAAGVAALLCADTGRHPERAAAAGAAVAAFVGRRLGRAPSAAVLRPLVTALLCAPAGPVRLPLARALAAGVGPLRDRLLAELRAAETDPAVLAVLPPAGTYGPPGTRAAPPAGGGVRRTGGAPVPAPV
ncbi:hypothetical protein [Streptomyces sp. JJ36]|uniref:hypothetical protein n=1 Tax=Streptomyces sp. JJ36 TaxID=2736645 RepID=UPI001F434F23|nr:hypothetical protein [Streptomyces sp. JJ36]MCF6524921.1 hypothetical protein [Streptomyces sp. JJ36]